jgi:Ribonuclease G/E
VLVHPEVEQWLLEEENQVLRNLETRLNRKILVESDASFHRETFEIIPVQ